MNFNTNIIVVATKLKRRGKNDVFTKWENCIDIQNIRDLVHNKISSAIPVLPLKYSEVFDVIFEKEKSISQLMAGHPLNQYHYREVNDQFNALYHLIDSYYAK